MSYIPTHYITCIGVFLVFALCARLVLQHMGIDVSSLGTYAAFYVMLLACVLIMPHYVVVP